MEKPKVVFSAVNFTEGGPLSILQDAVYCFAENFISDYQLILLVYDKKLIKNSLQCKKATIMEYSYPKKSWLLRLWFEYVHCYFISKRIKPHLWFALHDMTPNVVAENKIVYCHNPAPFYKLKWRDAMMQKSLIFFNLFYIFFYRINIRSNKYVIVQQQWLREEFQNQYKLRNIIVSHPEMPLNDSIEKKCSSEKKIFSFFYPSLPRAYKNFETLLKSAEILENLSYPFEVILTFDGSENKYASQLKKKYGHLKCVKFIGLKAREDVWKLYSEASCLVFTSTMETWGLPISEMKLFDKPIIVTKCKYAYETVGDYDKACFFEPQNALQLSELMKKALLGNLEFSSSNFIQPQQPFAKSWKDLFALVLLGNK